MREPRHIITPADDLPERKSPASVDALHRAESDSKSTALAKAEPAPPRKPGRPRLKITRHDKHLVAKEARP